MESELTKRWGIRQHLRFMVGQTHAANRRVVVGCRLFVFVVLDSLDIAFDVQDTWVTLYEILIVTAVGGYFTLRSVYDKRNHHGHESTSIVPRLGLRPRHVDEVSQHPSLTLAKIMTENPSMFTTVEAARSAIRYSRCGRFRGNTPTPNWPF